MAANYIPTGMGRIPSRGLYQERRERKGGEGASSRVPSGSRKVTEVGDDGSDRCGICSTDVLVRGVLDCCSHVFCFDCIDNWSTVSNLCPLCKLQFRFISVESTTVHGSQNGRHQFPPLAVKEEREEEAWGDEDDLPFSFPSFFIDEDAVACLEGDRCLIRAGVPLEDEDAADTSVACDSCDRWYHAGCVGFDPSVSWGSWLCPRCSEKASLRQMPTVPSFPVMLPPTTVVSSSASGQVPVAELAYNAPMPPDHDSSVSISMAEEGESALIFSTRRVAEYTILPSPKVEPQYEQQITNTNDVATRSITQASILVKNEDVTLPALDEKGASSQTLEPVAGKQLIIGDQKLIESTNATSGQSIITTLFENKVVADLNLGNQKPREILCPLPTQISKVKVEQVDLPEDPQGKVQLDSNLEKSKVNLSRENGAKDGGIIDLDLPSSYFNVSSSEAEEEKKGKRKQTKQDRDFVRAEDLPEPPRKVARTAAKKKDGVQASSDRPPMADATATGLPKSQKDITDQKGITDQKDTTDQKGITDQKELQLALVETSEAKVPFTEGVPLEDLVQMVKDENIGGHESNTAGGVRTRVVMRRNSDGRAAQLVEDIRQQMISAAGYGASDDLGKVAVSDDKFFAAFKAALVRTNEHSRGAKGQALKRRRQSWMSKMLDDAPRGKAGGVRESLTKKLYAGGVSRKTWDRDWDISFWKEQSVRIKKAKQEASDVVDSRAGQSVKEEVLMRIKNEDADGDSILTRLYVADTSLFPRNDDIKPLSMLTSLKVEDSEKGESGHGSLAKMQSKVAETRPSRIGGSVEPCLGHLPIPSLQGVKASSVDKSVAKPSCSPPPSDEKKDKRQWALELLARKSGATASSSAKGIKKESSLLGQVPEELKPTLPPDRRSRVPTAVRQAQLNRILEQYLRNAKLASLQGGYKLKSVIAAAVAKENEVYENSNTKGVYVNLCVRALAQQDEGKLKVEIPQPSKAEEDAAVTNALLATGLLSDSPPGSPCENRNLSIENTPEVSNTCASADVSALQEDTQATAARSMTSEVSVSNNGSTYTVEPINLHTGKHEPEETENVLELAKPLSNDAYKDLDLELEDFEPSKSLHSDNKLGVPGPAASSGLLGSPCKRMKVVLTTTNSTNSLESKEVGKDDQKNSGGGSDASEDARTNMVPILAESLSQNDSDKKLGQISQIKEQLNDTNDANLTDSTDGMRGKTERVHKDLQSKVRQKEKTKESIGGVKVADKFSKNPVKGKNDSTKASRVATVEKQRGSAGESQGDDWMNSGKFPDLESRIDKMRKDVLGMNPTFLSQFGEERIFGGPLQVLSSLDNVQEGGITTSQSGEDIACSAAGEPKDHIPEKQETDALRQSVQKQVEAYVKEHLKPLYKSGVIKSDQFRFAVAKTASKVMQHHGHATSADFLIVEGSKVKKLADQYLQTFVHKKETYQQIDLYSSWYLARTAPSTSLQLNRNSIQAQDGMFAGRLLVFLDSQKHSSDIGAWGLISAYDYWQLMINLRWTLSF